MNRINYGKHYTEFMNQPTNTGKGFKTMELKQIEVTNKKPTYVIDGIRVSRDKFETVKLKAQMFGSLSCFVTKVIELGDDRIKTIQYVTATY